MTDKCTGWAIVATVERPDGTWYDETITDVDDDTASYVDSFLTEYYNEMEKDTGLNTIVKRDGGR